jgi:hypothetical protein
MRTTRKLFLSGLVVAAGTLLGSQAQARDDVQWSVTIGAPGVVVPAPVYGVPVYRAPAPVYGVPVYREPPWRESRYHEPTRWDRDGDGIPNRRDRVHNPRWDRDGDGVPNWRDRHPGWEARNDGRYEGRYDRDHRDWRDGRDGRHDRDGRRW